MHKAAKRGVMQLPTFAQEKAGKPSASRRVIRLLWKAYGVFMLPVAFLAVCIIRLVSPIRVIRFGMLSNLRIGPFTAFTELYLCERDLGIQGSKNLDIFYYHRGPTCNLQLHKMWKRKLHIFNFGRIAEIVDKVNRFFPGYQKHTIKLPSDRDIHNLLEQTVAHLVFTPEEERRGEDLCRSLGIPEGAAFICINIRNSSYLKTVDPKFDFSYHDYRDTSLKYCILSMEMLADRGYFVLRMGKVVTGQLGEIGSRIIDYANSPLKDDFLDVYLCAKCSFFVGDSSGLVGVPMIFRRPSVWFNVVPLEFIPSWGLSPLFIPKKLFSRKMERFLKFREILESDIGRFSKTDQYDREGIEVIENTSEEILSVVIEMDERLKGTWKGAPEDDELQRSFWSLFKTSELHGVIRARIGAHFLRNNKELLE